MSWTTFHEESEKLASAAQVARWNGDAEAARANSLAAARAELLALGELGAEDPETYGVMAVSAAALFYKGKAFGDAKDVAQRALRAPFLPDFAKAQLKEIIWAVRWDRLNPRNVLRMSKEWFFAGALIDRIIVLIDVSYVGIVLPAFVALLKYSTLKEYSIALLYFVSAVIVGVNGLRLGRKR